MSTLIILKTDRRALIAVPILKITHIGNEGESLDRAAQTVDVIKGSQHRNSCMLIG